MREYIKGYIDSAIGDTSKWTKADLEDVLAGVLKRRAHEQWWDTHIPQLHDTPRNLWDSMHRHTLINYVISYLSPSFT